MSKDAPHIAVIGGGPAGLRAAEVAATAGARVTVFDAKPSVGRKFLVAGKGGLNLTHSEDSGRFANRYSGPGQPAGFWAEVLREFGPAELRQWAADLGIETFQSGSGRIYPTAMKAAPLLRRWVQRLRALGVGFEMNQRWTSLTPGPPNAANLALCERKTGVPPVRDDSASSLSAHATTGWKPGVHDRQDACPPAKLPGPPWQLGFSNGNVIVADAVILALGGASWPQTGSDGGWTRILGDLGIAVHPLVAANCGWECTWPAAVLTPAEGQPLKNLHVRAGETLAIGELLVTRYGLEGGAIYQLGAALRAMPQPAIAIDFKPAHGHAQLVAKMQSVRRDFLTEARARWKLSAAAHAILARKSYADAAALAREAKHCVIALAGPRPIAEAISSAGGICWSELDSNLMLTKLPGVLVAGEMIDWEAPTGGYLLQGCFATATRAAHAALASAGVASRPTDPA